ncbi:chaperonin 10-like protein, partial [Pavlovales sp. CCMP2436]
MEPITCRAAVAWGPKLPLSIEDVIVDPPKAGEVRVRVIANALCHTDIYTLDGHDPEGLFPCPSNTLWTKFRLTLANKRISDSPTSPSPPPFLQGCSTFSEVTVLAEISCAKISKEAPLEKVCLLGCGIATGCGKFDAARALGATDCINPSELPEGQSTVQALVAKTTWGVDYTFDCTGNTQVMRSALEASHRGWGVSCVIGVAAAGHEISTRPFQLVTGRTWKGTAFGGWKSRSHIPQLVSRVMRGELSLEPFITHTLDGIDATNAAVEALHSGSCLRAVVRY